LEGIITAMIGHAPGVFLGACEVAYLLAIRPFVTMPYGL
jgi:hypothetical protein